ncbi:DUF1552 domain-containing protein [Stieleria sp. TO1_6]|uniref:DUF1552 domain-containing protein n=1 Tax=Stieleria tagensis TaxID=2956795 RepID=UPI00209B8B1F|nr:DUF1552 domain-containing protein [Stieleria tagensis]MCO8125025.1 DUF1552 domain-containing protein [Stieleria tagensis]
MNRHLSRRSLLKASGICIGLPMFESMRPAIAAASSVTVPRRMVAINVGLGLHGPNMIPAQAGQDYELSPYLEHLRDHRKQFTVISGCSHPEVGGGHLSGKSFLTAARNPNSSGFKNTISIDQLAAEQIGEQTRFRSLSLSSSGPGLSWSRSGVEVPSETRPSEVFSRLFLEGNPRQKAQQIQRLQDGQSVLDTVLSGAGRMRRRLTGRDREKMDQYFEAVREAERRLVKSESWEHRPKPSVTQRPPTDETDRTRIIERLELMYDMMHLAIQTDSTRLITFYQTGMNAVPSIPGVDTDYHMLSHHGKDETKLAQLAIVESEVVKQLGKFLDKLTAFQEEGDTLLDRTMVLFGSNLGNASSHDTKNMPIVLAGGGFKHGRHLAFDQQNNYALPKLYVSMLQQLGLEVDQFADTSGTMTGLI